MNEQFKFEIKRKLASALSSVGGEWGNNNMFFVTYFLELLTFVLIMWRITIKLWKRLIQENLNFLSSLF